MPDQTTSLTVGAVIELSLAPVFLLVAIGAILNVLTQRLARVIDRARDLKNAALELGETQPDHITINELAALDRRMSYANWAINLCVLSALVVAFLVALLFLSIFTDHDASDAVALLFIGATGGLILGLCFFVAEISVATRTVRVRSEFLRPS